MKPVFCILALCFLLLGCAQDTGTLKVGMILPLSGDAAFWGESFQQGASLSNSEMEQPIQIIYEDSKGAAAEAVSAYHKLVNVDDVDVVVVVLSRSAAPLVPLAERDRIPLIITLAASAGLAEESEYAYRFFSNERQQATVHFDNNIDCTTSPRVGLLYLNDVAGRSLNSAASQRARELGCEIVIEEGFDVGTKDFRTQAAKLNEVSPDIVIFSVSTPGELVSLTRQVEESGLEAEMFETTILLSIENVRLQAGKSAEGVWTVAFPFALNETGHEFRKSYRVAYGQEPFFPASFGYDIVKLIASADDVKAHLDSIGSFESLNGNVSIDPSGEMNPPVYSVRILNGTPYSS